MKQTTSLKEMLLNLQAYGYPILEEDFLSLTPREARQLYRLACRHYRRYDKAKKAYDELVLAMPNLGQLHGTK